MFAVLALIKEANAKPGPNVDINVMGSASHRERRKGLGEEEGVGRDRERRSTSPAPGHLDFPLHEEARAPQEKHQVHVLTGITKLVLIVMMVVATTVSSYYRAGYFHVFTNLSNSCPR